ncbi:RecQ family ATP-dependent DNA helicase [Lacinutrix sp. C3R15]|uniref:RecQ family ATP-dependent DNA helicase n=1 Tax=Flavobacteriaceae TaxID=49546 RepID=UPI001C09E48A|nr:MULTISPECIES: RecQ family ATP-dependent DNA helicase [Flavobacteriaceae]MBU2938817.1 RecQ family ATP-dependent DNA helicase [Lacinutrix sp. C3R15]MDO6622130.1 RecQ family ATP-dependent DNA helicase [Oceanihabitans sp. 1_MG-2023]
MQHAINILERYWNFTSFRPFQEDIINAVIAGEDVMALMPTGGGKSLCFQIPALAKEGICIVVSPLIALMKNQVQALTDKGIKAIALTSGIHYKDLDTLLDNCIYGNYKFLYLSPERLEQELVQDRIRQMNVNLIAVDEAHCISQWGNDFRPSYKNIELLRQLKPSTNCIALTASATPLVVDDIVKELDFISPKIFKQSFARPNLAYMVFHEDDKYYKMESILKKQNAPSIIYVRNRKATVEISNQLAQQNISATFYHGGLSNTEKDNSLNNWLQNKKQVMVATNAFGMGIDKPDVKTVIHLNLPESMESYFQEAGRAGRNGKKAFAVILKNNSDEALIKNQFLDSLPTVDFVKLVYRKLCSYFQISYGEGIDTTHQFNFNQFCKTYKFNTLLCYNAVQFLDRTSVISLSKQFHRQTLVQFIISNASLFSYLKNNHHLSLVVKSILRTYGGIFDQEIKINTTLIADKASVNENIVLKVLAQLEKDEIISLNASKTDAEITFIVPREDEKTINIIASILKQQNKLKQEQVAAVLHYVKNNDLCKSIQLLNYFGEKDAEPCGICSVCITKKTPVIHDTKTIKNAIINLLESQDLSSRALNKKLPFSEKEINNMIQLLLEHHIIIITKTNTYKLAHL